MPDNLVYASDGSEIGPVVDLIHSIVNSRCLMEYLLARAEKEHIWFETTLEPTRDSLGRPLFMKKLEPLTLREIEGIDIHGPCEVRISEFGVRRGLLGNVNLIWGNTRFLDQDALVVATHDEKGVGRITVAAVGQPKKRKPPKRQATKKSKRSSE